VKAPTDQAVIISGMQKEPKYIIGRSSVRIPFLQRLDRLSLKMLSIDVRTSKTIPTLDYINIMVDSVANVKVSLKNDDNGKPLVEAAAQNFLNKDTEYIGGVAKSVLEGNTREIVGKMKLEEMVSNRQKFALLVKENAEPDLAAMGLDIVSFNVQNFIDNNNVIEDLVYYQKFFEIGINTKVYCENLSNEIISKFLSNNYIKINQLKDNLSQYSIPLFKSIFEHLNTIDCKLQIYGDIFKKIRTNILNKIENCI
jgi:hypothetical protein